MSDKKQEIIKALQIKIQNYYFTFGSDEGFPYQNGYLIVKATNKASAIEKFRAKHPDRRKGIVNCAFWYSAEHWAETEMSKLDHYRCFEVIE